MANQGTQEAALKLWPAAACLITELATELARLPAEELRCCYLILPTKRLVLWLMALLARQRPAFIPPRCFTLEDFIREHGQDLRPEGAGEAAAPLGVLSDLSQELLLGTLLQEGGYRHLRLGHEHEVKQLLAELTDWNQGLAALEALQEQVTQQVYLSDGGVNTLAERFAELRDLAHRFYERAREQLQAEPAEKQMARLSRAVAAQVEAGSVPWAKLYVVGLSSAQGMHEALFAALAQRPDVHFWLNTPPPLSGSKNPLALLLRMLGRGEAEPASLAATRPETAPAPLGKLRIVRADSLLGEVAHAIKLAEAAVASGLAPSAVALLVTSDSVYGKPLRALLRGSRLKPNLAIGTPLAQTELGTWLSALLELLASEATTARLLAFIAHPLTLSWGQDHVGCTPEVLAARLSRELCAWELPHGLAELRDQLSPQLRPFATALLQGIGPLAPGGHQGSLHFAAWSQALAKCVRGFLAGVTASYGGPSDDRGMMVSALHCLESFLSELETTSAAMSVPLSQAEFLALVKDRLLALDVRSIGDPLRGMQVLSLAEARYVPFELGIILGCSEGDFPRALPRDYLVDHYLKVKIGLPGWHLLEAIEDTTFHLLRARLPALVLSYPEMRGGEATVRSRFIEGALALGEAKEETINGEAALTALVHDGPWPPLVAKSQRRGVRGQIGSEAADTLLARQSATSLEYLLQCPYRFLLYRLGLRRSELPEAKDSRQEGEWLHAVLEAFFTGCTVGEELLPPLPPLHTLQDPRAAVRERLAKLTALLMPAASRESPLALHLERHAWPAFTEHVLRLWAQPPVATYREQPLEDSGGEPLSIEVAGRPVRLNGVIDALDRWPQWHLITDYKRAGSPQRARIREGLAPQLLLYAMAMHEGDAKLPLQQAVVGYWSILGGTWQEALAGSEVESYARDLGLISARGAVKVNLEGAVEALQTRWHERQAAALTSGTLPPVAKNCGYCEYSGVCRRDDPELRLTPSSWNAGVAL